MMKWRWKRKAASLFLFAVFGFFSWDGKAESPINLGVNGYSRWWLTAQNQAKTYERASDVTVNGTDVRGSTEIHFFAEADLPNAQKAGAFVSLEAGGNTGQPPDFPAPVGAPHDVVDMSYLYLQGAWGKLSAGAQPSVAVTLHVMAPDAAGNIGTEGLLTAGLTVMDPGLGHLGLEGTGIHTTTELYTGQNSDKIIYFTPEMDGLIFAVEYAPNGEHNVRGPVNLRRSYYRDFAGAAAFYSREVGDIHLNLSAGWIGGKLGSALNGVYTSMDGRTANGASRRWDEWNGGARLRVERIALGGSFRRSIDRRQAESLWSGNGLVWDSGVSYEGGLLTVSYFFLSSRIKNNLALSGMDRMNVHQVSGKYSLSPGTNWVGTLGRAEYRGQNPNDARRRNQGWAVMTGIEINF